MVGGAFLARRHTAGAFMTAVDGEYVVGIVACLAATRSTHHSHTLERRAAPSMTTISYLQWLATVGDVTGTNAFIYVLDLQIMCFWQCFMPKKSIGH